MQAAIEVLQLLPSCGAFEIRVSHKLLLDACLGQCEVAPELRQSALALLSTAAGVSPLHPAARPKLWPSIKSVLSSYLLRQVFAIQVSACSLYRSWGLSTPRVYSATCCGHSHCCAVVARQTINVQQLQAMQSQSVYRRHVACPV